MSHPMPRLCYRFGWKELNSHSLLHAVVLSIWPRGIKALFGSSDLTYLCGKAIHVSRREARLSNKFWANGWADVRSMPSPRIELAGRLSRWLYLLRHITCVLDSAPSG